MSNNSKFYKVVKLDKEDREYKIGEVLELRGVEYFNNKVLYFRDKDYGLYDWQVEEVKEDQYKVNQKVTFMEAIKAMEEGWVVQGEEGYSYKVMGNNAYVFSKFHKDWFEEEFSYNDIKQTYKIIGRWA